MCPRSTLFPFPHLCRSTVHDLQKPMDMSFRDYQTASLNGTFQVLSWGESPLPEGQGGGQGGRDDKGSGAFVGILFKTFEFPIYGGMQRCGGEEWRPEKG